MDDLRALDCQQGSGVTTHLPPQLKIITTPLRAEAWEFFLRSHPDRDFARYLQQGIISGFRFGFQRGTLCQPSSRNLRSAYEHPDIIDRYLVQEVSLQRVACFSQEAARSFPSFTLSPVGVIPKHNRPDKWRLIVDLSSPNGESVNDSLNRVQCSKKKYASIDDAVAILRNLGRGALMAKLDLKDAYVQNSSHPPTRPPNTGDALEGFHLD